MILGYPQRFQIVDNPFVQTTLGIDRAACKRIDADVGVEFGPFPVGWTGKAMGFMNDKPNVSIVGQDLEGFTKGGMNPFHKRHLLLWRVPLSHFDEYAWHVFILCLTNEARPHGAWSEETCDYVNGTLCHVR